MEQTKVTDESINWKAHNFNESAELVGVLDEWIKVSRKAHNFNESAELVGVLIAKVKGNFEGNDYIIENEQGQVLVYGKTALQTKLEPIEIGTKVKIVYLGKKKAEKTKRTYDDFEVYVLKKNTKDESKK